MFFSLASILLQAGGQESPYGTFIMIGLMIVVFYFFMLRPQQKRQKEQQSFAGGLKKGDDVVTNGGLHGKVVALDERTALLEVAPNTRVRFERSAISSELTKNALAPAEDKKKK